MDRCRIKHPKSIQQQGVALMVMMIILVMGTLAYLVGDLKNSSLKIEQGNKSAQLLSQAKDALIGNLVAAQGGQAPGSLIRPDTFASTESPSDYDGTNESGCLDATQTSSTPIAGLPLTTNVSNIRCLGRLPWKTLGLSIDAPSENDPNGFMPWYAVSANPYDPANPINSELLTNAPRPWLTVRDSKGNILSNRVLFIAFIPGPAINGQARPSSPNLAGANQYLDSITVPIGCSAPCVPGTYNNHDMDNDFIMGEERRWIPDPSDNSRQIEDPSYQFNDKLLFVTIDEVMPLLEKRVGNEIRKILNTYATAWGAYPFAAPFSDPSLSSFTGSNGNLEGLLPFDDQNYQPTWNAAPSISFSGAISGGPMNCILRNDVGGGNYSSWRCCNVDYSGSYPYSCTSNDITIPSGVTVTISGRLNGVGRGFWRPHNLENMCEARGRNTSSTSVAISTLFAPGSVSITNSLNSDGSANIVFTATGKSGDTQLERIELRDILSYNTDINTYTSSSPSCPRPVTSPTIPTWLIDNNWHQVAYYAVSPGYSPGNSSCTPLPGTPSCLTVNGDNGSNNKRTFVIMTSAALSTQSAHPIGTRSNYLEGQNGTPNDFIFENRNLSGSFNDQVITVAP